MNLPDGFVLDQAPSAAPLPDGFVMDSPSATADFFKSIPRGIAASIGNTLSAAGQAESGTMMLPGENAPMSQSIPSGQQILNQAESAFGAMPQPQGRAGRFGEAIGQGLGNPLSYIGPGTLPLKLGASILSSAASEGAGQATEGTGFETPARILGGVTGGMTAAKMLGPAVERAAIPTAAELKASAEKGYNAARNSGVEFDPRRVATQAALWEQELTTGPKYGFTGGPDGTAPKTLAILEKLQNPPAGAAITAPNLDTLRRNINNIAGETKDFKPTPDAKAAMVLKRNLEGYMEDPPANHIVAGDAANYVRPLRQANGDWAAASRVGNVSQRVDNAVTNTEGSIAAQLGNQIKSQIRPILKNDKAQRGFTPDEVGALAGVNRGTFTSNLMSQLGRGGAGVIPLMLHAAAAAPAAMATGGASIPIQVAIAAGLYGARKTGEQMTLAQAKRAIEQLAKRSPLYQSRVNALPALDLSPNSASLLRGGLLGALQ